LVPLRRFQRQRQLRWHLDLLRWPRRLQRLLLRWPRQSPKKRLLRPRRLTLVQWVVAWRMGRSLRVGHP
jgi:hypothetical protein